MADLWKQYQYHDSDDDCNDDQELARQTAAIEIGNPKTYGGIFYNDDKQDIKFAQHSTRSPPDVNAKTQILAVLALPQSRAEQMIDIWMLSDFWAFLNLFAGLTPNQTWLHCLDFEALLSKQKHFLHGNPYLPRKIVLDKEILSRMKGHLTNLNTPRQLKSKFETSLKDHCKMAEKNGEKVLVMMFGHGHPETASFLFANENSSRDEWLPLHLKTFVKRLGLENKIQVMLLSTACYSGRWLMNKDLNVSAFMAAGPDTESRSWRIGGSVNRHCGSMFATAVIKQLTQNLDTQSEYKTEEQEETYAELARVTYKTLLTDVDRRGWTHQISFSAQEDDWGDNSQSRTGMPLQQLHQRWESLKSYPPDRRLHPGDPMNRNPRVTQAERTEYQQLRADWKNAGSPDTWRYQEPLEATGGAPRPKSILGKRSISMMLGDSPQNFHSIVCSQGMIYLASKPGPADTASNNGLDTLLRRLLNINPYQGPFDLELLSYTLPQVKYRLTLLETANTYVEALGIQGPNNGERCQEFEEEKFVGRFGRDEKWIIIRKWFSGEVGKGPYRVLFPRPMEGDGEEFTKGATYVKAAIYSSGLDQKQCAARMEELVNQVKSRCIFTKDLIKEIPEVKSKRQKLAEACGKTLRDLSPTRDTGAENTPSRAGSDPRADSTFSSNSNSGLAGGFWQRHQHALSSSLNSASDSESLRNPPHPGNPIFRTQPPREQNSGEGSRDM